MTSIETKSGGGSTRGRGIGLAAVRGLALALVSLPGAVLCFVLSVVSIALIPIGVGIVTTPYVLTGVRTFANWRRVLAAEWGGVRIPPAYRPLPKDANPWARTFGMLRDPATWRDLRWLPVDMTAGFVTALLPAALLLYPLEGFALAAGLWRVFPDGYWYGFVPVTGQASALGAAALALVLLFFAHFLTPRLLHLHFRLTRVVLASSHGELAERVRVLTETRRDAVDTSAAELRRIERDLHGRVVLAEDLFLLRDGLVRMLEAYDFEIAAAVESGPELTWALAELQPDVAVVDVRLPPSHTDEGLQCALQARRARPGLPVLVLSQHVEQLYARELLADGTGGVGYLLKDRVFDAEQFIDAVRRVAAGGTAMDPQVIQQLLSRRQAESRPLGRLTPREREVLELMAQGRSNAAIAERLVVTERAIAKHTSNIFAKLDLEVSDDDNRRVLAVLANLDQGR